LRGWACASLTSKTISQAERTATSIFKKVHLFLSHNCNNSGLLWACVVARHSVHWWG
jgi:hypothetical protein